MALTRPILYSISAFDASQTQIFTFNVVGGSQVVKNRLTVVRQSDNEVIYQEIQQGFSYNHLLPAETLTNGVYYSAYVETYDSLDKISSPSNSIQFYCYTTPEFLFQNFPISGIIESASYNFEVYYNQIENEILNSYIFNLYNQQGVILATSGTLYNVDTTLPLIVSYTFNGLKDMTNYYIQITGVTEQGTQISTTMELFYVQYSQPSVYSIIELNNNCQGGYITIKSNLTEIDGIVNPDPPVYVDDNSAVDITGEGEYILWNDGYSVPSDFTASLWGHDFNDNSTIITMENETDILTINYKKDDNDLYYLELLVKNNNIYYYILSNKIFVSSQDEIQVWIKRTGNLYSIDLYNLTNSGTSLILNSEDYGVLNINTLG